MLIVPATPIEVKVYLVGGPTPHEMSFINVVRESIHVKKDTNVMEFKQINGSKFMVYGLPWAIEDLSGAPEAYKMKQQRIINMNKAEADALRQQKEAMEAKVKEELERLKKEQAAKDAQGDIPLVGEEHPPGWKSDDPHLGEGEQVPEGEETPEVTPLEGVNEDIVPEGEFQEQKARVENELEQTRARMATSPIDSEAPKPDLPEPKLTQE